MSYSKGFDVVATPDTACNVPLVSTEFAKENNLYTHALNPSQKKKYKVKMGDNNHVAPLARTIVWITIKAGPQDQHLRRRVFALVMPNLPVKFLLSLNTLKRLGILPKDWPHCLPVQLSPEDQKALDEQELSPLTEMEQEQNTCLLTEGVNPDGSDRGLEDTDDPSTTCDPPSPPAPGADPPPSRYELPDHLFEDSDVTMIPRYATLSPRVKSLLDKYAPVFQKQLSSKMHTRFAPVEFTLRDDFKPPPRARTCRPVPQHWRGIFDDLLDKLVEQGQIKQIMPSDPAPALLSQLLLVEKPNDPTKPRIVIDYSALKHLFLRRPMPQRDPLKIFARLQHGCKNFFVADMSTGYFQVRLKDGPTGSDVTAFICDRGVFKWLRMPMGIQPASDELSLQMELIFAPLFRSPDNIASGGAPMVRDLDDFLAGARTEEEFLTLLEKFLSICQDNGIFLNPSKFAISLDEGEEEVDIVFAGIKVNRDGTFKVNPSRLDAVRNFPQPTTRKQLQSWLGLCTSLGTFAPAPLHLILAKQRALARQPSPRLVWDPDTHQEFLTARIILSQESVLHQFDPKLKTGILTDVAKTIGMGIILFQHDPSRPITDDNFKVMGVWSITAKPSWKDLSPIETEILGFYHAWHKLQFYLLGADVIYGYVDHEPFVTLYHDKQMSDLSPRMVKLLKELLELPFQMTYLPGKSALISSVDALSRAPVAPASELGPDPLDSIYHLRNRDGSQSHEMCFLASGGSPASEWCTEDPALQPLFAAADQDPEYSEICDTLEAGNAGWGKLKDVPRTTKAQKFLHTHRALWAEMGILRNSKGSRLIWLGGERVFVPTKARPPILKRLDAVHNGADRAKNLARRSYWWPGMPTQIELHCAACKACSVHSNKPNKQHSIATPVPPFISHTLGMDFAQVSDKDNKVLKVLIVADYLSGWITYFKFDKPPTALSVVHKLGPWFHQSSWPSVICTDGEGILTADEFKTFLRENGIIHRLSSPDHAQSNGVAESAVKSFKRIWERCAISGDDFVEAWSLYNDTPRQPGQLSPSRLWYGRPIHRPGWWVPPESNPRDTLLSAMEAYIKSKESVKSYRPDSKSFSYSPPSLDVSCGDHVLMRDAKKRYSIPAVVMSVSDTGRAVRIRKSETGEFYKRNIDSIKGDPSFPSVNAPITFESAPIPPHVGTALAGKPAVGTLGQHTKRVTFSPSTHVVSFPTVGYICPLTKKHLRAGGWELTHVGKFPLEEAPLGSCVISAEPAPASAQAAQAAPPPTTPPPIEEGRQGATAATSAHPLPRAPPLDSVVDLPSLAPAVFLQEPADPPPLLDDSPTDPLLDCGPDPLLADVPDPAPQPDFHDPFAPHWVPQHGLESLPGLRGGRSSHPLRGRHLPLVQDQLLPSQESTSYADSPSYGPTLLPQAPRDSNSGSPDRPRQLVSQLLTQQSDHQRGRGVQPQLQVRADQHELLHHLDLQPGFSNRPRRHSRLPPPLRKGGSWYHRRPPATAPAPLPVHQPHAPTFDRAHSGCEQQPVGPLDPGTPPPWRSSLFLGRPLEDHLGPPPAYLKPLPPGSSFRRARFPGASKPQPRSAGQPFPGGSPQPLNPLAPGWLELPYACTVPRAKQPGRKFGIPGLSRKRKP